jgi:hypothetical protein
MRLSSALDLGRRDDVAVGQTTEVQPDAWPKKPVERHLVDRHHPFAVDRSRLVMDRRVHVGAVVRRDLYALESPAFAMRQVLPSQPREVVEQHRGILGVGTIFDLRPHERRIKHGIVVERRGQIEYAAGQLHGLLRFQRFAADDDQDP